MRIFLKMLYIPILALLINGCWWGGQSASPELDQNSVIYTDNWTLPITPADSMGEKIKLGFSQLGSESDWRKANTASVAEAAEEAGITLIMENAEQSQEKQFEAIRSFIEQKVDVIAIAPVVQNGWESILKEVKAAGIPVVVMDRSVNVEDTSLYVTFIGSDFYEEGIKAAKYALDKMRNHPGPIRIAELEGTTGSTPSIDRGRGFRDAVKVRDDMSITLSRPADFTVNEGQRVMEAFLKESKNKPPHILFSHNDDMALGAIKAIEQTGLKPGEDIIIISVDGTRQAFEMMVAGKINAVVECNPLIGPLLMQATKEIMAGRTLPKRMIPPEDIFTQENAATEVNKRKY